MDILPEAAVRVHGACKAYGSGKRRVPVLVNLNMELPTGTIYGLLGASGCGKTTLLSCVLGVRTPDAGDFWTLGGKPGTPASAVPGKRIGFMPQEVAVYPEFRVLEILYLFGRINGMTKPDIKNRTTFLLELLGLPDNNNFVKQYSGGQQRRISLAVALLHEPELLVLDEPTVGIDSVIREKIWTHLLDLATNGGKSVIITTHYIEEAKRAHRVGMMHDGRILAEAPPLSLMQQLHVDTLEEAFLKVATVHEDKNGSTLSVDYAANTDVVCVSVTQSTVTLISKEDSKINGVQNGHSTLPLKQSSKQPTDLMRSFSFKRMLTLCKKNYIRLFRNYFFLAFYFLLPMALMVQLCLTFGTTPHDLPIALVNNEVPSDPMCKPLDECLAINLSCWFAQYVHSNPVVTLIPYGDDESARAAVHRGDAWAVMTFPQNFSEMLVERMQQGVHVEDNVVDGSDVPVAFDMSNQQIYLFMLRAFSLSFIDAMKRILTICEFNPNAIGLILKMETPIYGTDDVQFTAFLLTGGSPLILFFLVAIFASTTYISERKSEMLDRLKVAGVTPLELFVSYLTLYYFIVFVQTVLVLVCVFIPFEVPFEGPFGWVLLLLTLQGTGGIMLGFVLSVACKEDFQALLLAVGFYLCSMTTTGAIWPLEGAAWFIARCAQFMPGTMAIESIRGMLLRGWGITHPKVYMGFIYAFSWIGLCAVVTAILLRIRKY